MRVAKLMFSNQTLLEIVPTSVAGESVRVRLSNGFGKTAVEIGAVHIAVRSQGAGIVGADCRLTFSGRGAFSIPTDAQQIFMRSSPNTDRPCTIGRSETSVFASHQKTPGD